MNRLILLPAFLFLLSAAGFAQPVYKTGDLLFQDLDCGELCDAIETVTTGYKGNRFSHIGLVYKKGDSAYVIEAIGKDVHLTPLSSFVKRNGNRIVQARLKPEYRRLIPAALKFALGQVSTPYDDVFIYNNKKYYCSELIYDAFRAANNNRDFFTLEPMTFKQPGSDLFFPVWVKYYRDLGIAIPEGKPGINPGGISRSEKLLIID